jgi:glycosyltransferase involved in cell wall biosynthesis|tara:strand:+ start:10704 stop:11396 length:693 start_codon:yes stop_codon:yes gene_type:complete
MYSLCVIIPFYNEELFFEKSLLRLLDNDIFEQILLVDDCSTDLSSEIAKKYSNTNQKITYLKTSNNGGKGAALMEAFAKVSTTHVVIHDADLEYDPFDIIEMKKKSMQNTNSLILGSRFIGNKIRENGYMRTYLANKTMSTFFSVVNNYKITDIATCYKLMPAEFIKTTKIKEKGFSIEIELLSKYLKFNKSVVEVPISYSGRSYDEGKKIKTSDGFLYLFNTVRYKFLN